MKSKKGEACIEVCVLIIVFCMMLSAMMSFVTTVELIRRIKRNSQTVLDSFVMKESVLIYNSIKNGDNEVAEIEESGFVSDLCEFCSLQDNGEMLIHNDKNGEYMYSLTKPKIEFLDKNKNSFKVTFVVKVPIIFCRIKMTDADVGITINSKFNKKIEKESF